MRTQQQDLIHNIYRNRAISEESDAYVLYMHTAANHMYYYSSITVTDIS